MTANLCSWAPIDLHHHLKVALAYDPHAKLKTLALRHQQELIDAGYITKLRNIQGTIVLYGKTHEHKKYTYQVTYA